MNSRPLATAIGGGTGLPVVLEALVQLGWEPVAVVTVADDGGNSGFLRNELGVLPPGDSRNCLAALVDDPTKRDLLQYRFPGKHEWERSCVGNLILAALADITGSFSDGLRVAGKLFGARGLVVPATDEPVSLKARLSDGQELIGQCNIANRLKPLASLELEPADVKACDQAVAAIEKSDMIVIGPGSLFTSIISALLVPGIRRAIRESNALKVMVCNAATQPGETDGFGAGDHLEAVHDHAGLIIDVLLTNSEPISSPDDESLLSKAHPVIAASGHESSNGTRLVSAPVADLREYGRHDATKLSKALGGLLS